MTATNQARWFYASNRVQAPDGLYAPPMFPQSLTYFVSEGKRTMERSPIGTTTVGTTTYLVYVVPLGPNTRKARPEARSYGLEGPNGATYWVTDNGPKYRISSMAMGGAKHHPWRPAMRPLRGLERSHVAAFYDHPDHFAAVEG